MNKSIAFTYYFFKKIYWKHEVEDRTYDNLDSQMLDVIINVTTLLSDVISYIEDLIFEICYYQIRCKHFYN